jgi:hypothetical protein
VCLLCAAATIWEVLDTGKDPQNTERVIIMHRHRLKNDDMRAELEKWHAQFEENGEVQVPCKG